jgi:hypothetical protein
MPPFDKSDTIGFLRRQELRATLRSVDAGQRALLIAGDSAFADALLEQPAVVSGLLAAENFIVENAKEQRLGSLFGSELAEIEEMERIISEANMIADLARVDLQSHSGMEPRVFGEFVKPVELKAGALWLTRMKDAAGNEVPHVIDVEAHRAHVATEREILDGKFYKDHAEYLADRAA